MTSLWIIDPAAGNPDDRTTLFRAPAETLAESDVEALVAGLVARWERTPVLERPAEILVDLAGVGTSIYHMLVMKDLPVAGMKILTRRPPRQRAEDAA